MILQMLLQEIDRGQLKYFPFVYIIFPGFFASWKNIVWLEISIWEWFG